MGDVTATTWRSAGPLLLLPLAALSLEATLRRMEPAWVEPPPEAASAWNPDLVRALTFGHWPVAVDWLLVSALATPGYSKERARARPKVYHDLRLAADLDPAFFELYYHGGGLLAVFWSDGEGTLDLLARGEAYRLSELPRQTEAFREKYWKEPWQLPLLAAYVNLFELDRMPEAAERFRVTAEIDGSPPYLDALADRLERPGGHYEVGLRLLTFLRDTATTAEMQARYERKRASLYVMDFLFRLNREFQEFLERQPQYRRAEAPGRPELERFLRRFLAKAGYGQSDPWGGRLSLGKDGRITTSTPYDRVFGIN